MILKFNQQQKFDCLFFLKMIIVETIWRLRQSDAKPVRGNTEQIGEGQSEQFNRCVFNDTKPTSSLSCGLQISILYHRVNATFFVARFGRVYPG